MKEVLNTDTLRDDETNKAESWFSDKCKREWRQNLAD